VEVGVSVRVRLGVGEMLAEGVAAGVFVFFMVTVALGLSVCVMGISTAVFVALEAGAQPARRNQDRIIKDKARHSRRVTCRVYQKGP
jgi:hypothetical protein